MATLGLLHPGEMGAAVGGCLVTAGHTVLWDPSGRSRATTGRALAAELTGVEFGALISRSSVIFSICPPHAALDVARQVADGGFGGVYVDANAISVATAERVASIVTAAGAVYVDGGIIGLPPDGSGRTRLYLSGASSARAGEVSALFARSALDARVVDGPPYAASAVKMAYAAWTKGSGALLLACRALARAEGVEETLLAEWAMSQPGLAARSEGSAAAAAAKGWRWVGEMEEIAASMSADGLPPGFHQAAAEIYDRAAHADEPRAGVARGVARARSDESDSSSTLDTVISALT
jgi:3-hydroxyisobutyrate dehydrogenase-like beta-hydroxyacid dehydrogenase